jgi:hypothetical protein
VGDSEELADKPAAWTCRNASNGKPTETIPQKRPQQGRLAANNNCLAHSNKTHTGGEATNRASAPSAPPVVQIGAASAFHPALTRSRSSGELSEGPSNMQPMNLKAIARDATQHGDSKTLFHALDLLGRLMPIASARRDAFNDFCTELDELRLHGGAPTAAEVD